jgi:anti-sigma-K factor RskA
VTVEDHSRYGDELAAYLLGALEPPEASALERHLEGCERCRAELRWLEPAVQALPESVERLEPPPRLRESLMREVRGQSRPAKKARRWFLRPALALGAVLLVAALIGGYEIGRDGSGEDGKTSTVVSHQPGGVTVKMVRTGNSGTLQLSGVGPLPRDKVLEAWVQRDGRVEAVPALFVPDREGRAATSIEDMRGVEVVMVTEEPPGGSPAPTSKPIATMNVVS